METPKFSIIIATIGSPYLQEILSVFLSSSQSLEIILVIDSPEVQMNNILDVITLNNPKIKIIHNEKNIGLTRSLNKGIAQARGNIIVRSDDDDISKHNRLDELANFFDAHPKVDIAYSYAEGIDEDSCNRWVIKGPIEDSAIKKALPSKNCIVHSSLAFRRHRIETIGFYDESFRNAQDYDLYLRAIRAGFVFGCIPKVLLTRLYHKNSITVSHRKKQILHSMAAKLLHVAQSKENLSPWPVIIKSTILLMIPNWARTLRRRLGLGK